MGLITIIGILYGCEEKIDLILRGPADPTLNFFSLVWRHDNGVGASLLTALMALNIFLSGMSIITVLSRVGFAMCRDGCLPGSKSLYYLNHKTKSPDRIIIFLFLIMVMLSLLPLVSNSAFSAITQISTICL